jgi:hypothetical protein
VIYINFFFVFQAWGNSTGVGSMPDFVFGPYKKRKFWGKKGRNIRAEEQMLFKSQQINIGTKVAVIFSHFSFSVISFCVVEIMKKWVCNNTKSNYTKPEVGKNSYHFCPRWFVGIVDLNTAYSVKLQKFRLKNYHITNCLRFKSKWLVWRYYAL